MRRNSVLVLLGCLCACGFVAGGARSYAAAPSPSFTVTATSVTLPPSGEGELAFTLTSVNGYTGQISANCAVVNPPVGAKVPYCTTGPVAIAYTLTSDGTATGSFNLSAVALPLVEPGKTSAANGTWGAIGTSLAGALLLGFGLRRKGSRRWMAMLVAVSALGGLAGIAGCGGGGNGLTPGTYTYKVTATDISTNASVSTTASVTVP